MKKLLDKIKGRVQPSKSYSPLEINNNIEEISSIKEFKMLHVCGQGTFSSVYKAEWTERGIIVAAKKVLALSPNEREILDRLKNEHIIETYGTILQSPDHYIIMEYAAGGSLYNYLRCRNGDRLTTEHFYRWTEHATEAVRYLGSIHIAHRDIKSPNYLITENQLKLCDFGTAKFSKKGTSMTSQEKGSAAWMAPEMIRDRLASEKSDVYSLGVVIWELFTGGIPHAGADNHYQIMWLVAVNGVRPTIPEDCPAPLRQLMKDCWEEDRYSRPTAEDLLQKIRTKSLGLPLFV
ncbi:mitogen-activated protein kinase kinase kinase 20-like [Antedon mediterranea]|uniref:mitogen-activated protein kinase kinase kinase 20-like n=1 Tax=Antedon mediterranea TaxID=105859 RepID=UPI003AF6C3A6